MKERGIKLNVVVYPWPTQIHFGDLDSRQVRIWRDWCEGKCATFLNLFPVFFDEAKQAGDNWYEKIYIDGDVHFNRYGNTVIAKHVQYIMELSIPLKTTLNYR